MGEPNLLVGVVGVGLLPYSEPFKGLESVSWTEGKACTEVVIWEQAWGALFLNVCVPQTHVSMPIPGAMVFGVESGQKIRVSYGISACISFVAVANT